MNPHRRHRAAAAVLAVVAAAACGSSYGSDPIAPAPSCEGGDCSDASLDSNSSIDANGSAGDGSSDADNVCPGHNLAGCLCATTGAVASCYQGVPGPKSACTLTGTQTCESKDGELRWSACTGGSEPAATDTCFDEIDDNCNGVLNEGCACSDDVDLCDGPTLSEGWSMVTRPTQPVANQPFDIFFLTKSDVSLNLELSVGSTCLGEGLAAPCPSAGKNCPEWKAAVFRGIVRAEGTYKVEIFDASTLAPCTTGAIADFTVKVDD